MIEMLNRGEKLPVDFNGRFIYYVGPVDAVREGSQWGPAGPTTATRMDKFTRQMLEQTGVAGDGRQGGARAGGDRGDPGSQGGVSDGDGQGGLSGEQSY